MPHEFFSDLDLPASRLRLETLVRLRWLAVSGQAAAVAVVHGALGFPLPLGGCLSVIAVAGLLNLYLIRRYPVTHRFGDDAACALLAFDIVQLAALLFLTGGLENPFSMLFLAPVMISAAVLPPTRTLALGILAVAAATLLCFWHKPLPWDPDEVLTLPLTYRAGVWFAILLGVTFIGVYAWRVSNEARQLAQALAATELVLTREQHLSQLDGLAAAAAHELGTPLATIALVTKELKNLGPKEGLVAEDLSLLVEQVSRCREILAKITSLGAERSGPMAQMRLGVLLEEVASPQRPFDVRIAIQQEGQGVEPVCRRNPAILYGLGNLVENAVDFARTEVSIQAKFDAQKVEIAIGDDGQGFPPEILGRAGDPYLTTRGGRRAKSEEGSGMGLGLFIAKTLLERSGATLSLGNGGSGGGALAKVIWPRSAFERGVSEFSA
jgi:two-component system, sensor histidine kinase RegB